MGRTEIGVRQMREAVIVEAVRTPIGKRNGTLSAGARRSTCRPTC